MVEESASARDAEPDVAEPEMANLEVAEGAERDAREVERPARPAEPVSPAKEWGAAAVIMLVFGLLIAAFVGFLKE